MENRRRAERRSARWMGRCHIEDEPPDLWRECTITDVSTLGVGIDFCHPDPIELLGLWQGGVLRLDADRRITVWLRPGPSVDLTVAGEVRNAGSRPDGMVRAGIEFLGLTETERSIVDPPKRRALRRIHLRLRRVRSLLPSLAVSQAEKADSGRQLLPEMAPVGCDDEQDPSSGETASRDDNSELVPLGGTQRDQL